jgi:HPt (histidine-containing phosphotransfer) domain-containing protein
MMIVQPATVVLDRSGLFERFGGDVDFVQEVSALFLQEYPQMLDQVRSAVARRDAVELQHAAHTLKGCVSNFGADCARAAAAQVEVLARQGALEEAPEACALLETEIARFAQALAAFSNELSTQ